jgi:protein Tex
VDIPRQRIGLSMRLDDEPGQARGGRPAGSGGNEARGGSRDNRGPRPGAPTSSKPAAAPANSAFADALSRALKR